MKLKDVQFDDIYYTYPDQFEFLAEVLACDRVEQMDTEDAQSKSEMYQVVLDQTAFYPEGGGQLSDVGVLGGVDVIHVSRAQDGTIVHLCLAPLEVGAKVQGQVSQNRRLDASIQHTGEHIISGIVKHTFGCDNKGFHMNEAVMTLDFERTFSQNELNIIETKANQVVRQNLPVQTVYIDADQDQIIYRAKLDLSGQVRLIDIPDVDVCACCGTHVSHTSLVGLIKIIDQSTVRGGARLTVLCGERADRYMATLFEQAKSMSQTLSCPILELNTGIQSVLDEQVALKARLAELNRKLNQKYLQELPTDLHHICVTMDETDVTQIKWMMRQMLDRISGDVMVVAKHPRMDGYQIFIQSHEQMAKKHWQGMVDHLTLKGGGTDAWVQGISTASLEDIQRAASASFSPTMIKFSFLEHQDT